MLNPLIHYELEMAHAYQAQLRRKAALWQLAQQSSRSPSWRRFARKGRLQLALTLGAILLGAAASAGQAVGPGV
jgi:hypothetical protein